MNYVNYFKKIFLNFKMNLGLTNEVKEKNYSLKAKSKLETNAKIRRCQTYLLQVGLQIKASFEWMNREIQGITCSSRVRSIISTRL